MRVRRVRCPSCGAPKITPTPSAYVYCDYCARFMDWDVQAAKAGPAHATNARSAAVGAQTAPKLAAARASGDAAGLAACHRATSAAYMDDFPHAYSPRLADPAYREAMLARTVHGLVVRELAPACRAADAALARVTQHLQWDVVGEATLLRASSFWPMYEAIVAADVALQAAIAEHPQAVPDPDDTPPELSAKIRDSGMAQAWIHSLDPATGDAFLDRTHLRAEYEEIPDPVLHDTTCTWCGAPVVAPQGARKTVCASCGHVTVVGRALFCGFCGGPMVFGIGAETATCEHCKAESRLMAQ